MHTRGQILFPEVIEVNRRGLGLNEDMELSLEFGGSLKEGLDYRGFPEVLSFPAGVDRLLVTVTPIGSVTAAPGDDVRKVQVAPIREVCRFVLLSGAD